MNLLLYIFDINNIFFTFLGYQMSYLEFFGTILTLWSVWLVSRNNILNWPIGNLGVIFFGVLFFQIQLYSDFIEQIYFLITGFYGWWVWWYLGRKNEKDKELAVSKSSKRGNIITLTVIVLGTLLMGYLVGHIHIYFPKLFTLPASFPYLDAFTTVMSFVATILLAHKKIESWLIWIVVDVIGIWLYFTKGVVFISLLYFIFLILATNGLFTWRKIYRKQKI